MPCGTCCGAHQYIEMEREGSRKPDLSPPRQPTASSLGAALMAGSPEMAAWAWPPWNGCPPGELLWRLVAERASGGTLGQPVWALSAAVYNTGLREKHANQYCGKISRAGDRHFLGMLQVYMIYNGVFSNTGSPSCPGPCSREKASKNLMHFQSL